MIVVVCPGQGSQTPGFLEPWLAEPGYREHLAELSDAAGIDLAAHGTTSDADTIRDTAVAQPLIVAAGLLALRPLLDGRENSIGGVAGHSVGEFTAAAAAGIFSEQDAIALVRTRSQAMAQAAALTPTGMSAVIGGDEEELLATLKRLDLHPANFNGAGQIVVAGELAALETLPSNAPAGARVIPLQVAGAFHTRYMESAVESLRDAAATVSTHNPRFTIWSNRDGQAVSDGSTFRDLVVGQVSNPVRWDKTMASFDKARVSGIIEVTPAGALTGLAKRALKGVPTVAIKTPDDLPAAIELIENS